MVEEGKTYSNFHPVERIHVMTHKLGALTSRMFLRTPFQAQELNLSTVQYTRSNYDQAHGEDERDGLWIPAIYGIFADVNNTISQILDHS